MSMYIDQNGVAIAGVPTHNIRNTRFPAFAISNE